ncbi:hypothetical protein EJ05DRAFT_109762 [Pseudovirgaria hyperparasitica]|uniref:Nucleotide-diphospho-sugar transferase domain-containing protein n=1 Tax=Pseudovirgaria hyperparasitica TaxID=470096 RepID=A0A6A6VZB7_9PEZI|nr:uncharacterized protein EJ05DRAFT_109762 [Pseudovirgaria hyperparasitica]KAF2755653.1 hypothetical protein EJ05DRAFT_109762 [Pseudovirgaria hyperparasitica]
MFAEHRYTLLGGQSSMATIFSRWRKSWTFGMVATFLVVIYLFFGSVFVGGIIPDSHSTQSNTPIPAGQVPSPNNGAVDTPHPTLPFDELIRQLWEPQKLDITAPEFVDQDGDLHKLPAEPFIKEKLGKRLLILDVDTRPYDGEGELFNTKKEWDWNTVKHLSAGIIGHYMYSVIHGYDYLMLRAPRYEDRHDAWGKVLMMEYALKNHDYVVFYDSDAIMANPEVPIEWLMNYWQITSNYSIAIASESLLERDKDEKGNPGQNSGFMIVNNIPKTHEIYRAWAECPEESHYPGCAKWKQTRLREQSAFSNYVVYEYKDEIKILPCAEANGYPEQDPDSHCKGVFLRHHWMHKELTKDMFAHNVMRMWAPRIHKHYMDNYNDLVEDLQDKKFVGSKMVDKTA